MATRFGAAAAHILSFLTRILGVILFYALRITYRPKERLIAFGIIAVFLVPLFLYWLWR